jgi:hypothetical protein
VETSANLVDWIEIASGIEGTGQHTSLRVPNPGSAVFFRVADQGERR